MVAGRVKPAMVEPVDVLQSGQFQLVEAAPRTVPLNQLRFVQSVHGLGERVDAPMSSASRVDLGWGEGAADLGEDLAGDVALE